MLGFRSSEAALSMSGRSHASHAMPAITATAPHAQTTPAARRSSGARPRRETRASDVFALRLLRPGPLPPLFAPRGGRPGGPPDPPKPGGCGSPTGRAPCRERGGPYVLILVVAA